MLKIASTSVPSGCLALDMASAKCTSKHSVFHRDFLVLILISFPFQSKPCWFSRKTRRYRRSITRVGQRHIVNKPWHRGLNEQTKLIQNDHPFSRCIIFLWLKIKRLFDFHSSAIQLNSSIWTVSESEVPIHNERNSSALTFRTIREIASNEKWQIRVTLKETICSRFGDSVSENYYWTPDGRCEVRVTFVETGFSRFREVIREGVLKRWWCRYNSPL